MDIGSLKMKITADSDDFDKKISKTKSTMATVGKVAVGAAVGVAAIGTAAFAAANKVAESTDRIDKMSQQLGMSREGFQKWEFVLSQSGVSIDNMSTGMKTLVQKMQASTTAGSASQATFKKLGVNVKNANGEFKDQEQVFNEVVVALQGMEDGVDKAAISQELFGRSGQELLPLLNATAESTEELMNKAEDLGLVLSDETVDAGVKFTDSMDQIKRTMGTVGTEIAADLLPTFQKMADWTVENLPMIKDKFADGFDKAKEVLGPVVDTIRDDMLPALGDLWDFVEPNLPAIGEAFANGLSGTIDIVQGVSTGILGLITNITNLMNKVEEFDTRYGVTSPVNVDGEPLSTGDGFIDALSGGSLMRGTKGLFKEKFGIEMPQLLPNIGDPINFPQGITESTGLIPLAGNNITIEVKDNNINSEMDLENIGERLAEQLRERGFIGD